MSTYYCYPITLLCIVLSTPPACLLLYNVNKYKDNDLSQEKLWVQKNYFEADTGGINHPWGLVVWFLLCQGTIILSVNMGSPTQYWQLPYKSRKYEWFSLPNYVAYTFSSVFLRTIDIYQDIYFFFFPNSFTFRRYFIRP